jgi:uncharacterized membrane protein YphA (DoxX/SURF4 family)
MLSLFPEFFDWSWYVPFFFRVILAYYFITAGYRLTQHSDPTPTDRASWLIMGSIVIGLGILFLAGLFIQPAGVIAFSVSIVAIYFAKKHATFVPESVKFYTLVGLIALSLLFLGPGPFAFDLPL